MLVNSFNNLKYSACGYSNPELIFDDLKYAKNNLYSN